MRYILFNIAVGAALIYLFKGGELALPDIQAQFDRAKNEIAALTDTSPAKQTEAAAKPLLAKAGQGQGDGHGHDTIHEPAPKPLPQPAPPPKPKLKPGVNAAPRKAPPLPVAKQVAARPEPKLAPKGVAMGSVPTAMPAIPPVPPAPTRLASRDADPVLQRRAEVLAEGAPVRPAPRSQPVALKAGTSLMTAAERRRELDTLADEMEMLYIEKIGG